MGDKLCLKTGRPEPITALSLETFGGEVYNFLIEDLHCYAVGNVRVLVHNGCPPASNAGRAGKQAQLRAIANDPNTPSRIRGWIQQDLNAIVRGQRSTIRVPYGMNLAHRRGFEAKYGFGYEFSDLQDVMLHRLQHAFEGY